jgi:hypothetical protein
MPMGPGRYDHLCTYVREAAQAKGALVIIIDGKHGPGFACQADALTTASLPDILEQVARQIREGFQQGRV